MGHSLDCPPTDLSLAVSLCSCYLRLDHLHPRSSDCSFEERREVLAIHARGGDSAKPRMLMRQRLIAARNLRLIGCFGLR
jgi:hypothetical protein